MGIRQKLASQLSGPTGGFGWLVAWVMPVFSTRYSAKLGELLDLRPEDDLLEVPCGAGAFLQKHASQVGHWAGLDHSEIQVRLARRRNRARIAAGTGEVVLGDAAALPWQDSTFSAVLSNCVDSLTEPLRSLKEMSRVLSPGGRAALAFAYYASEDAARKAEHRWGQVACTEPEVRQMIQDAGFTLLSISRHKNLLLATANGG